MYCTSYLEKITPRLFLRPSNISSQSTKEIMDEIFD